MAVPISIPPNPDYRKHIQMALSFILANIVVDITFEEKIISLDGLANYDSIAKLNTRLSVAKPNKPFKIIEKELYIFYICFILMNKVLVSKCDDLVAKEFIKLLPDDHFFKDFNDFRDDMIRVNSRVINITETTHDKPKDLEAIRNKLAEINLD